MDFRKSIEGRAERGRVTDGGFPWTSFVVFVSSSVRGWYAFNVARKKKSQLGTCPFKLESAPYSHVEALPFQFIAMGGGAPLGVRNNPLLEFDAIVALPKCRTHRRAVAIQHSFRALDDIDPFAFFPVRLLLPKT